MMAARLARRRYLWRSSTPSRLASSTSFAIARWVSRASVGCAIAFSWTVVSIATRSRSLVSIAPVRWATERLSCNSATICSSPSRWRQRVSDERSNGSSCRNTTSPQKYWKYGFSTHRSHSASSERLCICLRMNSPATSRVGNGGCPGPTRHTELKRPARKSQLISPASRTSGWRRLMISSRSGRNRSSWRSSRGWLIGLPQQRISPSKESRTTQIGNPKPQENRHAHPAFLQNRLLAQVKSSRSINRFRILHGRLFIQTRGVLKKALMAHLRATRQMRQAKGGTTKSGLGQIVDAASIRERPEADDRAVPGHWEGDLLCGANNTHIATLVERHTRFVMLLKVPSKDTATVVAALGKHVRKLPQELRRSLTRDRGMMADHKNFTVATHVQGLFLRSTQSLAARQQREHQRLAATVFPEGNRSLALLSGVPEQDRAAAQSTPAEDLGLRNPCR